MCFYIHRDQPKLKVATRSIRVWKRFTETLRSPYRLFQYEPDKEYRSDLGKGTLINQVHAGLHAYTSFDQAWRKRLRREILLECTVPKGATYYWNPSRQEIVSNRLVIKEVKTTRALKTKRSFPNYRGQTGRIGGNPFGHLGPRPTIPA